MSTVPLAAEIDTGNDPVEAVVEPAESFDVLLQGTTSRPSPAQTASSLRCERLVMLVILHRVAEDEVRPLRHPTVVSNEPPFLRGQVSPMQDRRPGSSPRGITVAGQRRDLTGFAGPTPPRLVAEATVR